MVLVAAAAIGLAACGGSSSPHVASLPTTTTLGTSGATSGSGSSTTTPTAGNPTQLLNEWAACMRSHGDPNQADPTITANKVIDIIWDPATPGGYSGTNKGGQGNSGPGQYCRAYLTAAQTALQGGRPRKLPSQAEQVKYSECMRANGIPDFPDPTGNGQVLNMGGDLIPSNPTFQHASKVCAQKTGVPTFGSGATQSGMIELNGDAGLPANSGTSSNG